RRSTPLLLKLNLSTRTESLSLTLSKSHQGNPILLRCRSCGPCECQMMERCTIFLQDWANSHCSTFHHLQIEYLRKCFLRVAYFCPYIVRAPLLSPNISPSNSNSLTKELQHRA